MGIASAKLINSESEEIDVTSGYEITRAGEYILVVKDKAGNSIQVSFTVSVPIIVGQPFSVTYMNAGVAISVINGSTVNSSVTINNLEPLTITLTKNGAKIAYVFGKEIKEDGEYISTIVNEEGKKFDFKFTILTKVQKGFTYACPEGFEIYEYLKNGVKQTLPQDGIINLNASVICEYAEFTVYVRSITTDESYVYKVTIDTIPPELTFENFPKSGVSNKSVKLLESSKTLGSLIVTKDGEKIEADIGTVFRENGKYSVMAIDEIGNESLLYTFTIEKDIDIVIIVIAIGCGIALVLLAALIGFARRKKKMSKV